MSDLRAFALTGDNSQRHAQLHNLVQLLLRAVVLPHLQASAAKDGAVELRLFSHRAAGAVGRADLVLDWGALFGTREAPLWATPEQWTRQLLPSLADVREVIGISATTRLRVDGRFHLSAAYALGHQFAATTSIKVETKSTTSNEWWGIERNGEEGHALLEDEQPGGSGREVTVEISLSQDARVDVTEYLKNAQLPIERRVQLTSPPVLAEKYQEARAFVTSAAHASTLADQIADTILRQKRASKIHLFGPLPQALAVLVGLRLNTARPIQCYEYVREDAEYIPSCLLR